MGAINTTTLNDFKALLGKANDGNVVFTEDGSGLEKANHGNKLTRAIHHYRVAASDETTNVKVRATLMNAILNSPEGKTLSERDVAVLHDRILGGGNMTKDLARKELNDILGCIEKLQLEGGDIAVDQETGKLALTKAPENGKPAFGNAMIARQKDLILARSTIDPRRVDKAFDYWTALCRQAPSLTTAQGVVDLLPKLGIHGFSNEALAKFVKGNFASVQSQFADKVVWMVLDAIANRDPNAGNQVELPDVTISGMLRDVLTDMMEAYGAKSVPMPRVETLMAARKTPAAAPTGEQAKAAFTGFRQELKASFDVLFARTGNVDQGDRQVRHFRSHVENALLDAFRNAYAQENGGPEQKLAAARAAVKDALSFLREFPADQVSGLLAKPATGKAFRAALESSLGRLALDADGNPSVGAALGALRAALDEVAEKASVKPLVDAYLSTLEEGADLDAARAQLTEALERANGADGKLIGGLRAQLLEVARTGENVANKAVTLCSLDAFRTIADAATAGLVSPERLREQRNALFAEIADVPSSVDPTRTVASYYVPTSAEVEQTFRRSFEAVKNGEDFKKLSPEDREKAVAEQEKLLSDVKAVLADKAFAGKVTMLSERMYGALNPRCEAYRMLFGRDGVLALKPETARAVIAKVEELTGAMSVKDVSNFAVYIGSNLEQMDSFAEMAQKPGIFKELIKDGSCDFVGMDPNVRKLFLGQIAAFVLKGRASYSLDKEHLPAFAMKDFYREMRAAVLVDGELVGKKGDVLAQYLADSGLSAEEMPENWDPAPLFRPDSTGWKDRGFFRYGGFGTYDPVRMLGMLSQAGLTADDLKSPDSWMRLFRFQAFLGAAGGKADGLVEWVERVTGKPYAEATLADCDKLLVRKARGLAIEDPQDKLKDDAKTAVDFLGGNVKTDEAPFKPAEMPALLAALRKLDSGSAREATVVFFGQDVTFLRRDDGSLTAKLSRGAESPLSIAVVRSSEDLIRQIEDAMTAQVGKFGVANVKGILPKPPQEGELVARPRELYARVLSSVLGMPSAHFAHLSTAELAATANEALDGVGDEGKLAAVKNRFATPPAAYNNAEAVELQQKYLKADDVEKALVKLPKAAEGRTLENRQQIPPAPQEVHDLVADLFMNKDTWSFDEGNRTAGQRLLSLFAANKPELEHVKKDPGLLDSLPEVLREPAKAAFRKLFEQFPTLDFPDDDATRARLAAFEADTVKPMMDAALAQLQAKATALFQAKGGDDRPLWQKSLADVNGTGGLDADTPNGKFTLAILGQYFTRSGDVEKRAMLSAFIRNADKDSSDGAQVAETLKGAGPLLQKMLQGLPSESFDPETQKALKDMKSKLPPIPDAVIKAQLLELVRSSRGEILSVEVKRSIGQATVGQALLCHVRTKAHPVTGEDVVIKLLRPNVQTAVQRERALLAQIARELDQQAGGGTHAQEKTFEGRYRSVLEEFDFTLEAENVDLGIRIYDNPKVTFDNKQGRQYGDIHSMRRMNAVKPMTGMLVLEKAEGASADRHLENVAGEREKAPGVQKKTLELPGAGKKVVFEAEDAQSLMRARMIARMQRNDLVNQRESVERLLDVWMERALFGDGVFHNDLHPGNVMVKKTKDGANLTAIDFGNVMRLKSAEQQGIVFMCTSAMTGDADAFIGAVADLLLAEDKGKLNAVKAALKKDLEVVLAKGTAQDVLPRLLAGLAVVQSHGAPVPETVHNFAQSVARLQTVVESFDAQIRACEDFYAQSVYGTAFAAEISKPVEGGPAFDAFKKLDALIVSLGEPGKPHSADAVKTLGEELARSLQNGQGESSTTAYSLSHEYKNRVDHVTDPIDHVDDEGNKTGAAAKEILEGLRNEVFKQEDGGVAFLKGICRKYGTIAVLHEDPAEDGMKITSNHPVVDDLGEAVAAYETALKQQPPDEAALQACRREVERRMLGTVLALAEAVVRRASDDALEHPQPLVDFVRCLGNSLIWRQDALRDSLLAAKGVSVEVYEKVMEIMDGDGPEVVKMIKAGTAALGHLTELVQLKGVADKLSRAGFLASIQTRINENLANVADQKNDELPFADRVPAHQRRALKAIATAVCHPKDWKPSLATEKDKETFLAVIGNALETARKAVAPETLTASGVKYFARLMAGAFADAAYHSVKDDNPLKQTLVNTGLHAYVHDPDKNKGTVDALIAAENLKVEQNDPQADKDLVTFLQVLRDEDYGDAFNVLAA